ncbi:MAG: polymorphic outer membrane protein, partial [Acidimicrobiaceae bacterium]
VGECGVGPGFINCFDPAAQGEMWRALAPIGSRIQPNVNGAGAPQFANPVDDGGGGTAVNEVGDEIWESTAATLALAFSQLSSGECTFAHLGDGMGLTRQCKAADGSMVPPPEGRLFYPAGLAVDGTTVYVSDRMNHRVTTMHFEGDAFALAQPIGNGEPGTGGYAYTTGAAAGLTGSKLNAPNGLAVDGASHLLVADGGNARIAIFDAVGADAFASHFTVPVHPLVTGEIVPTYVAVTPGASVVAPGTAPANPDDRIVVVDRYTCTAWIMDAGFNPVATLPAQLPQNVEPGTACVSGAFGYPSAVGEFSILTGVTVDAGGHIYLADSWNNRILIYDRNGVLLGAIGEPPVLALGEVPPVESLETPSSVLIDHNGRLVVNDSDNLRLAFYEMTFDDPLTPAIEPPTAAFQFEVPAPGDDIEGFPTALAEQWGNGPGLDPAGRYLKIDTANHRVQRIELADLAIVREQAQASTPITGTGSFAVAVPAEKIADVAQVTVTVVPDEPGVVVTSVNALPPALQPLGANDIPRGSWVEYSFTYTNPVPNQSVTFRINATGNTSSPQPTSADEVVVVVRGVCAGCAAEHTVYDYPAPALGAPVASISQTTDTGDWYNHRVFVRLSPVNDDPNVTSIEWYVRGADMPRYGSGVHASPLSVDVRYVDVPLYGPETDITYWPVTVDDTVGPKVTAVVQIDMGAPTMTFGGWPLPAGVNDDPLSQDFGTEWYTGDVTADTVIRDEHAGVDIGDGTPDQATGTVTVTGEGRDLFATPPATDLVGNTDEYRTDDPALGGKVINIDRTPPVVIAPHIEVVQTGVGFAVLEPGVFVAAASDNLSGIAAIINPDVTGVQFPLGVSTRPFTARNHAGLVTTVDGTVTVIARERSSIAAIDGSVVYGDTITLTASVLPTTATGGVTFTFGGATFIDDTIVGGIAAVEIPVVTVGVGTYTMDVAYSGDAAVAAASTTATVIVTPAPITVRPDHQEKPYGTADPVNTLAPRIIAGALVGTDAFFGTIERAAGENVGDYALTRGTLDLGPNYRLTFIPSELTIVPALIVLAADPKEKVYGDSDPPLTYSFVSGVLVGTDIITGVPTRVAGELPGLYAISLVALTAGPNYEISFSTNYLQIVKRDIFVTADTLGKLYGEADPPLTYSYTPALVGTDAFDGLLRRVAGETPGIYAIEQFGLTLPIGYRLHYTGANFVIGRRQATITAGDATKVWGTALDPAIPVSSVGFLAADNIVVSVSRAPGEDVAPYVTTPAADGAALGNYDVTPVTGTFTITKARVSVTADDVTVDYGQTPVFAFTYGLFPGTATAADIDIAPTCTVVPAHTNLQHHLQRRSGRESRLRLFARDAEGEPYSSGYPGRQRHEGVRYVRRGADHHADRRVGGRHRRYYLRHDARRRRERR